MIYPSFKEFLRLSKTANVIPVYKEINADLDTPVSAYLKLNKDEYSFLLESVEGQEKIARYSFLGTRPSLIFRSKGRNIEITRPHADSVSRFITATDPLDEIKKIMRDFKPVHMQGLPRFCGGLVGFIGYDAVRFFEKIPDKNPDTLKTEDFVFILADTILVFDHVNHTIKIVSNVILPGRQKTMPAGRKKKFYDDAVKKIEAIQEDFKKSVPSGELPRAAGAGLKNGAPLSKARGSRCSASLGRNPDFISGLIPAVSERREKIVSNYKKSVFQGIVAKAKDYIKKGDIIQVVLSQRFSVKIDKKPFDIYRSLRSINPSPYMFFLKLRDVILVGSSPEILVRCEDGFVQTRPIAGTRPRGKTEQEDRILEKELLNDIKEKAEHIMLVDLGRNDLGRVCKTGSVTVSDFMSVERYSHVMHLVTEVRGELEKTNDIYDVLRASFPAGTVSGSPKIRAMEIIDVLENSRRGPYAGCVGYFSFSQNMDTCITIRTIVIKDGFASVQAGAGIVADSVPEKEYLESVNKAKALIEAIVK